ncbi:hypothetical protein A2159_00600 [Candidatus Woesebacteria bacterium RBG_13_34_9]|uniref:Uncharacterized protein n=1 Tax=Candidatus Woesebacteria bacterium RBG_13_34_9 TaxID=1802477 RepID=A0A1F7X2A1_9BACT|nr:MAG: hypothetical protein A2159_00600 [Candidatus Woesebacteria bacterium RBG_13_34_9]
MLTKTDLSQITNIFKAENKSLENKMNKRFDKLDRKLDYAINFLDRDYLKLLHRVERIEEHLHLEPSSI